MDRCIGEFITTGDASHRLGVSTTYVKRLIDGGHLPVVKTALGALLDPADVDRFAAERAARKAAA